MKALKCDCCGKFYEGFTKKGLKHPEVRHTISIRERSEDELDWKWVRYDLCPECWDKLRESMGWDEDKHYE